MKIFSFAINQISKLKISHTKIQFISGFIVNPQLTRKPPGKRECLKCPESLDSGFPNSLSKISRSDRGKNANSILHTRGHCLIMYARTINYNLIMPKERRRPSIFGIFARCNAASMASRWSWEFFRGTTGFQRVHY